MDGGRRTSTVRQIELLVEFAEANVDLALGRLRSKEAREMAKRLWAECAATLNSEGPARLPKEWAKIWNDMKCRARSKLTTLALAQRGTGGGPAPHNTTLSALEERVANIIGRDVGPIPEVAQDPLFQADEEIALLVVEESVDMEHDAYVSNNTDEPGPSARSLPCLSPTRPAQLPSQQSETSTPRRRRQRPRQRTQRPSRVNTQAQTSRTALDESRAIMTRIEEMRARTDLTLAETALKQAEAAVIAAEASRLQARAMAALCQSVQTLVPDVKLFLRSHAKRLLEDEEDEEEDDL